MTSIRRNMDPTDPRDRTETVDYVARSTSQWTDLVNKACGRARGATYTYANRLIDLKEEALKVAEARDKGQPVSEPQPSEESEAEREYQESRREVVALLNEAKASKATAENWSVPGAPTRYSAISEESAEYHRFEATFLADIVDQLIEALAFMEEFPRTGVIPRQIEKNRIPDPERRQDPFSPNPPGLPGTEQEGPDPLNPIPPPAPGPPGIPPDWTTIGPLPGMPMTHRAANDGQGKEP